MFRICRSNLQKLNLVFLGGCTISGFFFVKPFLCNGMCLLENGDLNFCTSLLFVCIGRLLDGSSLPFRPLIFR